MKLQTRYRLRVAAALAILLTSLVGFGSVALAAVPDEHANDKAQAQDRNEAAGTESAGEGPGGKFECDPTHGSDTGKGANTDGPGNNYHNTCEAEHEPGNGVGDGAETGQPCAGCVGNADDKNPPGQADDGGDANKGYECDENQGVGKENPAHTGCEVQAESNPPATSSNPPQVRGTVETRPEPKCPNGASMPANDVNGDGVVNSQDCAPVCPNGASMPNVDVNGDGAVNLGDCAPAVLGVSFSRPTEVLGVQLARTGASGVVPMAQLGFSLTAAGAALSLAASRMRRRSR